MKYFRSRWFNNLFLYILLNAVPFPSAFGGSPVFHLAVEAVGYEEELEGECVFIQNKLRDKRNAFQETVDVLDFKKRSDDLEEEGGLYSGQSDVKYVLFRDPKPKLT